MPTASDLVTDLPADFETFGQAVATSMADLLGGTTGQVLSKASNTDMDFTWVTSDDANAIQNAIVDAKGDLIAASAADTPARLAVGANNTMLVADSTTATGLAYKSAATLYPWTTYSPTTSGFTKGNGTEIARYQQIGKTVFIDYSFTFGSTSAMTGMVRIGMPVSPAGAMQFNPCGNVLFEDKDTAFYLGSCVVQAYDWINVYLDKADGTYTREGYTSSTVPFTWGNTDRFFLSVSYEAA
jgi:hypothetical protein